MKYNNPEEKLETTNGLREHRIVTKHRHDVNNSNNKALRAIKRRLQNVNVQLIRDIQTIAFTWSYSLFLQAFYIISTMMLNYLVLFEDFSIMKNIDF